MADVDVSVDAAVGVSLSLHGLGSCDRCRMSSPTSGGSASDVGGIGEWRIV